MRFAAAAGLVLAVAVVAAAVAGCFLNSSTAWNYHFACALQS